MLAQTMSVNVFHLLVVFPILIMVGYMKCKSPDWMFTALVVMGVIGSMYHAHRLYSKARTQAPSQPVQVSATDTPAPSPQHTDDGPKKGPM